MEGYHNDEEQYPSEGDHREFRYRQSEVLELTDNGCGTQKNYSYEIGEIDRIRVSFLCQPTRDIESSFQASSGRVC